MSSAFIYKFQYPASHTSEWMNVCVCACVTGTFCVWYRNILGVCCLLSGVSFLVNGTFNCCYLDVGHHSCFKHIFHIVKLVGLYAMSYQFYSDSRNRICIYPHIPQAFAVFPYYIYIHILSAIQCRALVYYQRKSSHANCLIYVL